MRLSRRGRPGADDPLVHERDQRRSDGPGPEGAPRRASAPEHPFLFLQRAAGNAAVSRLVANLSVQRVWPFDDEEEVPKNEEEDGFPNEGPEEEPEGPAEEPEAPEDEVPLEDPALLPDPTVPVQYIGSVQPGSMQIASIPLGPGAMVESCRGVLAEWASSLPYEVIPAETTSGGGMPVMANATEMVMTPPRCHNPADIPVVCGRPSVP